MSAPRPTAIFHGSPMPRPSSCAAPSKARGIVFLDRDGVLNELVEDPLSGTCESPLEVEEVRLVPGAAEAVVRLASSGLLPVCVTNQPAAAKGRVSLTRLHEIHERVIELLAAEGAAIAASYICPHHPRASVSELAGPCHCRKPAPGLLLAAARAFSIDPRGSWMVGDTDGDVQAGRAAGCSTVLVRYPGSFHKRSRGLRVDLAVGSLAGAARILSSGKTNSPPERNFSMVPCLQRGNHAGSDFDTYIRRRRRPRWNPRPGG